MVALRGGVGSALWPGSPQISVPGHELASSASAQAFPGREKLRDYDLQP